VIEVEIKEYDAKGDNKIWEFSVTDKGTGISTEELNFLMNTGSSSKNFKKANLIDSMPLWLQPSGVFGIGFQSIFMLTEQVKIETKSFFTEQFQIVELNSPNSAKDGNILIQKKTTDHKVKPGSKLSFKYETKAIPERYSYKIANNNVNRIVRNYDPFSNDSLDIEMGKVFDEIFDFANKSCIPINLIVGGKPISTKNNDSDNFSFFDEENALEMNIGCEKKEDRYQIRTFYKNQPIEKSISNIKFLWIALNIHKDKATKVLTLNRNEIRPEYYSELYTDVLVNAGIERGEHHRVPRLQHPFRVVEIALAVGIFRRFNAPLNHLRHFHAWDAQLVLNARYNMNESLFYELIPCGGEGEDVTGNLAAVIAV
jgi:hypothetical protein